VINGEETSRSKLNSGFNACSEARQVGQSLKLDYFLCSYRVNFFDGTAAIGTIRNYINADLDTLWLTKTKEVNVLPENIQWVCGKCEWRQDPNDDTGRSCYSSPARKECTSSGIYVPFRCMAINFPAWRNPGAGSMFEEGTIRTLLNHEVSEVLIVVGDFERCERMRDVSFVPPSQRPHYVKHAGREAKKWGSQAFKKKWSDMEEDIVNMMDDLKLARAEARKRAMNRMLYCLYFLCFAHIHLQMDWILISFPVWKTFPDGRSRRSGSLKPKLQALIGSGRQRKIWKILGSIEREDNGLWSICIYLFGELCSSAVW